MLSPGVLGARRSWHSCHYAKGQEEVKERGEGWSTGRLRVRRRRCYIGVGLGHKVLLICIDIFRCRHVGTCWDLLGLVPFPWNGSPVDLSPGLVGVARVCGTCNALCKWLDVCAGTRLNKLPHLTPSAPLFPLPPSTHSAKTMPKLKC